MPQYPVRKANIDAVRHTVREHLRCSNAALMEKQTRLIRQSILLAFLFAIFLHPAPALAALLGVCWGLYGLKGLNKRFFQGAASMLAIVVIGELMCLGPRSTGLLVLRGIEIIILLFLYVKWVSDAYGRALSGIDKKLADAWKKQWKLFRNSMILCLGAFVISIPLGRSDLWTLSILGGGLILVFLSLRGLRLLGRTVRSCRDHLRMKIMVDSLGE